MRMCFPAGAQERRTGRSGGATWQASEDSGRPTVTGSASRVSPWSAPRPAARSPEPRPTAKGGREGPQADTAHCMAAGTGLTAARRPRQLPEGRRGRVWDGEAPEEPWQLGGEEGRARMAEGSQREPRDRRSSSRATGMRQCAGVHAPSVTHATGSMRTLCPPHGCGDRGPELSAAAPTCWLGAAPRSLDPLVTRLFPRDGRRHVATPLTGGRAGVRATPRAGRCGEGGNGSGEVGRGQLRSGVAGTVSPHVTLTAAYEVGVRPQPTQMGLRGSRPELHLVSGPERSTPGCQCPWGQLAPPRWTVMGQTAVPAWAGHGGGCGPVHLGRWGLPAGRVGWQWSLLHVGRGQSFPRSNSIQG